MFRVRGICVLHDLAWLNIVLSGGLAVWALVDLRHRPPPMTVMRWVWPLTFVWGGLFALAMYLGFGRNAPSGSTSQQHHHPHHSRRPFWQSVALGASHCGAGCSLADLLVEGCLFLFGVQWVLWGHAVFGAWVIDFAAALLIGVIFQYVALAPMRDGPRARVWLLAFQSDVLSLTAWQVGMYGWMALCIFVFFGAPAMRPDHAVFWFMMQVAMLCGFAVAYPVNWLLIRAGVKEAM